VLRYIEISECMLERGQFRCDVNISVRPRGSFQLGNRSEIKNMSSFKFIMDALEYEMKRQIDILESGGRVDQETRLFDEVKGITLGMRSKEDAPDYRYFPDPDLLEIQIDQELIDKIQKEMPELPDQQMKMIIRDFGIAKKDAIILTRDKAVSEYLRLCASLCEDKRRLANWIIKDLFKLLNEASFTIDRCLIIPDDVERLINLISSGKITESIGRTVLEEMFKTGRDPETIINEKGLKTISEDNILKAILEDVIAKNPEAVIQIKAGETKPIDFLMGQVMRHTKGKADPKKIRDLIRKKLAE
jgi:aspartyl-tRNA(Asn)/glutamyl-tRNA(Gln) amidotransferase subunit B